MDNSNPVWNVYDNYRTIRLNVKCYSVKLNKIKNYNLAMEGLIAIAASSTVAGFWIWNNEIGLNIWKIIGIVAAILAIMKPLLKFPEKIQKCEELVTRYRIIDHDYQHLVVEITDKRKYTEMLRKKFYTLLYDNKKVIEHASDVSISNSIIGNCQKEVLRELPASSFYLPEE